VSGSNGETLVGLGDLWAGGRRAGSVGVACCRSATARATGCQRERSGCDEARCVSVTGLPNSGLNQTGFRTGRSSRAAVVKYHGRGPCLPRGCRGLMGPQVKPRYVMRASRGAIAVVREEES
jgi:hypothetical protein